MITTEQLDAALRTALETAGRGYRGANPLVGACVLDAEGNIIATGFHLGAGHPHAEVDALRRLGKMSPVKARELTMVVTLEPCNHTGRTGPCARAISEAGIGQVHYAVPDNTAASGGADYLRSQGVQATQLECSDAARNLNQRTGWHQQVDHLRSFAQPRPRTAFPGGRHHGGHQHRGHR